MYFPGGKPLHFHIIILQNDSLLEQGQLIRVYCPWTLSMALQHGQTSVYNTYDTIVRIYLRDVVGWSSAEIGWLTSPLNFFVFFLFLSQINLYQSLLRRKHGELIGNMERLEGGLEKLKSTAAQASVTSLDEQGISNATLSVYS